MLAYQQKGWAGATGMTHAVVRLGKWKTPNGGYKLSTFISFNHSQLRLKLMPICNWFVGTYVIAFLTAEAEASQKDTNVKEIWAE